MADESTLDKVRREVRADTERVIAENLRDPDLAVMSKDYQDGYARGFTEATIGFVLTRMAAQRR